VRCNSPVVQGAVEFLGGMVAGALIFVAVLLLLSRVA
jgi:hypothetical protein